MKLCLIVAAIAVINSGCRSYPTAYSVGLVGFNDDQAAIVVSAANRWHEAVGVKLNFYPGCNQSADSDICVYALSIEETRAHRFIDRNDVPYFGYTRFEKYQNPFDPVGPVVYINVEQAYMPGVLSHTVQHEFGHAFGLIHSGVGTVMFAETIGNVDVQPTAAQNVTEADAIQYRSYR